MNLVLIVIFHYHLWELVQTANSWSWWTLLKISCIWVYTQAIKQEKIYKQEHLKLIHINVSILNTHLTVTYLRFTKNTIFMLYSYNIKQKNCKCIGFFHTRKLTITDKMTSFRKFYISKSVKKQKTITCWKIWKYLGF